MVIVYLNTQDVSLSAAGINHYKAGELIPVVNKPDSYIVAIGHFRPSLLDKNIVLKFPSRESDYLLDN